MKIGLFMTPQWKPGEDLERGVHDLIEQARTARDAGFESLLVGQHVVTGPGMQMLQTFPLMARLLPEIEGMTIGPGIQLLSMMSPVMAAEEGATMDWMSGGHYVLAGGLGYRPEEFEAMGVERSQRGERAEEAVEVIKRLWTEERVTHHGRHFRLTDVGASVRPMQRPRPPIWLGGDVDAAVRRAARIADAWLGSPTSTFARLGDQLALFAEERRRHDLPQVACPVIRECFVGRDADHAARISRGPLLYKYEAYAAWGHNDREGSFAERFDDFCGERFLVGDGSRVRELVERHLASPAVDRLMLRVWWPGLEQDETLAVIRRIGRIIGGLPG